MSVYDIGDQARLGNYSTSGAAVFANLGGTATNPTAVLMTVKKPDGTSTVYAWPTPGVGQSALANEATGRFYADVTFDQGGIWRCRLAGTGAVVAAAEWTETVRRSTTA